MKQFSKALIRAINEHLPMADLLEELGTEVPFNGLVYCPFHMHRHDTKSAKVYGEEKGNCLWCFSEQRNYRPFNVIREMGLSPYEVRSRLPQGAIDLEGVSDQEPVIVLPVVDAVSMGEFKESGDLPAYLDILDQYWTHKENLKCQSFARRR